MGFFFNNRAFIKKLIIIILTIIIMLLLVLGRCSSYRFSRNYNFGVLYPENSDLSEYVIYKGTKADNILSFSCIGYLQ